MRSSDPLAGRPLLRIAAYCLAGALALGELVVLALALSPDVEDAYRAYYIDRTTTCREKPAAGTYEAGQTVSFRPDGREAALAIRVCGWDGPAGDGTHSLGNVSLLRVMRPRGDAFQLTVTMAGIIRAPANRQRVEISIKGVPVGSAELTDTEERIFSYDVPPDALDADMLDIEFAYPDAHFPALRITETEKRAIKLTSFRLAPA